MVAAASGILLYCWYGIVRAKLWSRDVEDVATRSNCRFAKHDTNHHIRRIAWIASRKRMPSYLKGKMMRQLRDWWTPQVFRIFRNEKRHEQMHQQRLA
jgi:hypothetical protein